MDNAIQLNENKDIVYSSFTLHKNGITPNGDPTFEEWCDVWKFIQKASGAVHFWIGDALNYGEQKWGEMYAQAMETTGFDYQTLADDKYVSAKVPLSHSRENLSFSSHREVASLSPERQEELLEQATREGLRSKDIRALAKGDQPEKLAKPKYSIDYCEEHGKWCWVPFDPQEWEGPHE